MRRIQLKLPQGLGVTPTRSYTSSACYFGNTQMAAKDHEGFQQFPNASDAVPNQVVLEEEIELKLSLLEGHQSIGESEEDPYNKAVKYLEEHHIIEIFQVICYSQ